MTFKLRKIIKPLLCLTLLAAITQPCLARSPDARSCSRKCSGTGVSNDAFRKACYGDCNGCEGTFVVSSKTSDKQYTAEYQCKPKK